MVRITNFYYEAVSHLTVALNCGALFLPIPFTPHSHPHLTYPFPDSHDSLLLPPQTNDENFLRHSLAQCDIDFYPMKRSLTVQRRLSVGRLYFTNINRLHLTDFFGSALTLLASTLPNSPIKSRHEKRSTFGRVPSKRELENFEKLPILHIEFGRSSIQRKKGGGKKMLRAGFEPAVFALHTGNAHISTTR